MSKNSKLGLKPISKPRTSRRRLGIESLEKRELMAGNVTAVLNKGTLTITGDSLGNGFIIEGTDDPKVVRIVGTAQAGGDTTINGSSYVEISGVTKQINVNTNGGDDNVVVMGTGGTAMTINRNLKIETGSGNDSVTIGQAGSTDTEQTSSPLAQSVNITGYLYIKTEAGDDTIAIANTKVRSLTTIDTGDGDDSLLFPTTSPDDDDSDSDEEVFAVDITGNIQLRMGDGEDTVSGSNVKGAKDLQIFDYEGAADIVLTDFTIKSKIQIVTGNELDTIELDNVKTNTMQIATNDGDDQIHVDNGEYKSLLIRAGDGYDAITISDTKTTSGTQIQGEKGGGTLLLQGYNQLRKLKKKGLTELASVT